MSEHDEPGRGAELEKFSGIELHLCHTRIVTSGSCLDELQERHVQPFSGSEVPEQCHAVCRGDKVTSNGHSVGMVRRTIAVTCSAFPLSLSSLPRLCRHESVPDGSVSAATPLQRAETRDFS